ncbi:MAG: hypothetical protein LJE85_07120 [Gammaproteobacteria bacterium]|nr:hypothetical protein [Gammaproteobacteria bacterium]
MASSEDRLLHIGLKSALSLPFEPVYAMQPRDRSTWPNDKFNTQQYHYDKNGVSIKVTYRIYEQGNVPSIDQIADRVSKQLSHIPGLELIDLTQQRAIHLNPANQPASETNNLTSIAHSARFLFQPFAKEIHYEVRNYIEGYRQWMVSVSYKSCDARGRILVKEFLDTLAFIPVGT